MAIERQQTTKPAAPTSAAGSGSFQRTGNFLKETFQELQRTRWPSRQEASRLTAVVVGVIVVLGVYMGVLDYALSAIVQKLSIIK